MGLPLLRCNRGIVEHYREEWDKYRTRDRHVPQAHRTPNSRNRQHQYGRNWLRKQHLRYLPPSRTRQHPFARDSLIYHHLHSGVVSVTWAWAGLPRRNHLSHREPRVAMSGHIFPPTRHCSSPTRSAIASIPLSSCYSRTPTFIGTLWGKQLKRAARRNRKENPGGRMMNPRFLVAVEATRAK